MTGLYLILMGGCAVIGIGIALVWLGAWKSPPPEWHGGEDE